MHEELFFTRCYWRGSAGVLATKHADGVAKVFLGGLRSGLGSSGAHLSRKELEDEFEKHITLQNLEYLEPDCATALVSASDRIIDTLKRAFNKYYEDGEPPEEVYIVFIRIPATEAKYVRIHRAEEIAPPQDAKKFWHEVLFEWAIPERFVVHRISVKTLLNRGLTLEEYLEDGKLPQTKNLRPAMAQRFFGSYYSAFEVGLDLGFFAKDFGARAPSRWIAERLVLDICPRLSHMNRLVTNRPAFVKYPNGGYDRLCPSFLNEMNLGINTCLYEWWLYDEDFCSTVTEYEDWRDIQDDIVLDLRTDFFLEWKDEDKSSCSYMLALKTLRHKVDKIMDDIEVEAVAVGL